MNFFETRAYLQEKLDNIKLKWLKLIYTIVYFKLCLIVACLYLFKYSSNYSKLVDLSKIKLTDLNELAELRGLQNEENRNANKFTRSSLKELISNTGA